ncbi:MAG: hypothetical protein Q9227_004422 [Pyrenula ochraceoflavens]
MAGSEQGPRKAIIGGSKNFWLHSTDTGFDLTHPPSPTSIPIVPRVKFSTTTADITVDPKKTALVIIDMQNFFLSPSLGRPRESKGLRAADNLLNHAIPAARKAGIRIIWLNWGLTEAEIEEMPPATRRAFGFENVPADAESFSENKAVAIDDHGINQGAEKIAKIPRTESGKDARIYRGLGTSIGKVKTEDGTLVEAGRLLMRHQWNTDLPPALDAEYRKGLTSSVPDVWIHKNRMSGLWGASTLCTEFLEKEGIRTLIFSGVNTDQCVGGSLQDAFTKGYDCILLNDGAATTSPDSSQESIEFNCAKTWGFLLGCEAMAQGVNAM